MSDEEKLKELGISSPQESIAKAIDRLSSVDRIKMMSVIPVGGKEREEVDRLTLMYSVGEELDLDFLVNCADIRLMLFVSCQKGRGRHDVADVVKQPAMGQGGLIGGIKDKISSFIHSDR